MGASPKLVIPPFVLKDWQTALQDHEPRALELGYALKLALPSEQVAQLTLIDNLSPIELGASLRKMLETPHSRYQSFVAGSFSRVDLLNPSVFAFERSQGDERLLIVNNLARVSQAVKFGGYPGRAGWDILNRVEFQFPPRAQLEAYEFLWLLVD